MFIARYHYDSNGNKVRFITKEEKLASTEERLRKAGFDDEYIAKELYKIKQQNEYELNSKEALENRLLDMYISVISNVNNFSEVRQPLDTVTDYLKNHILADVDNLTGAKKKDSKASALYFATPQFQSRTKSELSGGKNGIAPFALAASHHSLTQQVGLRLIPNKILNKFGITNIAGIQSKRNNYHKGFEAVNVNILDWLSAMINAHVDVAKDPYIIRLNVRKLTFNMTNFLIRTGQGESTLYFLPQQILKDFATEYDRYSGFYGVDLPSYKNPESVAFENTKKKYIEAAKKAAKSNKTLEAEIKKLFDNPSSAVDSEMMDINWLRKQLDVSSKDYKSFNWYYNQLRVLLTYNQLSPFAKELSELTSLSQIDTKKFGNNFGLQSSFLARWSTFLSESKVFDKPVRMLTDTFLYKKLTYGVIFPRRAFRNIMLRLTPEFDFWRNKLLVMTGNIGTKNDDVINAITRSMEAYYKSAFFDKYCTDNNININDLLYGSNSIVNRFNDIKNKALSGAYPELLGSDGKFTNVLFRTLIPRQKFDNVDLQMPDFFELKMNKDADDNVDNLMIRAWEELMDSNSKEVRDFAKDLAVYAFYTSGDAFGRNNFFKYVPNSLREELGYFDYLRNLENNPSELVQFEQATNKVFRNLWWNEDIVPTIEWIREKEVFESGQLETIQDKLPNVPSGYTVTDDNGTELEIPGLIINNRYAKTIGNNAAGDIIYSPYVKIKLNGTNDPRFVMLYRFIGIKDTHPVYKLIPKFGVNYQGMTVVEFGSKLSSLPFNNPRYSGSPSKDLDYYGYGSDNFREIIDIIPQSLNTLNAINDIVNTVENQNSLTEIPQQVDQEQTTEQQETINIYAGTGENADLSNFAVRPFKYESFEPTATVGDSILFGSTKEVNRVITFNTVEGAFQAQKLAYAAIPQTEKEELENKLSKASGTEARKIGRSIQNLDKESWDKVSSSIMKDLITASFEQNPDALQRLLSTGNVILTHTQDKGKWGTEFPRILMEVRDELRNKNQEQTVTETSTPTSSQSQLASEFDKFVADNSVPVEVAEQIKSELPKAEDKAKKVNDDGRTYTFNNGFKVNLKFKLNEQQIAALRELENFIEDDTAQTITLSGYAGTGKTTIISILRQYLDTIPLGGRLIFSAPTHRANYVTKMMSPDAKVITLASLFGFTLDVDLSLNKYDLNTLKAKQKGEAKINNGSLIIIDEASMIQDSLYSLIQEQLQMLPRTKIIFVGDAGQLRPVESKTKSKVFSDQDTPLIQLTKVERTGDNPILKESTRVRNGEGFSYQTEVDRYGNGVKYSNDVTTIEDYIKYNLSSDRFRYNKLFFKILAGTNAAVSKYNQMARDVLYGSKAKFIEVGELITGYANKLRQMDGTFSFINSGDYIVTETEDKEVVIKTSSGIVTLNATKCKMLNALDPVSNEISLTFINPSPSEKSKLVQVKNYIDELWSEYREAKRIGDITRQRVSLRRINEISEQINVLENIFDSDGRLIFSKTADYGYASTIHKSQGGTYNKVLIDDSSIESFRGGSDIKQELRYVAVSRASEDVMIATSKASNQKNTEFDDFDDYIVVEDLSKKGEQRISECKKV